MNDQLSTDSLPQIQDVNRIIENTKKIKNLVDILQGNIKQTALNMLDNFNDDETFDLKEQMKEIDNAFLTTIALNEHLTKYSAGAVNLKNFVESEIRALQSNSQSQETRDKVGSGENLADKYLSDYKKPLNIEKYVNHKDFKQLKREIAEVNGQGEQELGEDEDLAIASQSISINCPITQGVISEPYKSMVCNHVFSKEGIFSLFRNSNSSRCPVAGCSKTIQKNQIQAYPTFTHIIKRELRKKEKEKAKQTQEDITEV